MRHIWRGARWFSLTASCSSVFRTKPVGFAEGARRVVLTWMTLDDLELATRDCGE